MVEYLKNREKDSHYLSKRGNNQIHKFKADKQEKH